MVLREMRRRADLCSVPVLMLTGRTSEADEKIARFAGRHRLPDQAVRPGRAGRYRRRPDERQAPPPRLDCGRGGASLSGAANGTPSYFFNGEKIVGEPQIQPFDWSDPFDLDHQLTDEERLVRDTAEGYAQDQLQPRVTAAYLDEQFDREILREMGALGAARRDRARAIWRRRARLCQLWPDRARGRAGRQRLSLRRCRSSRASSCTRSSPTARKSSATNIFPACRAATWSAVSA